MVRALARDLGREDEIEGVRVPRREPGPPETLTDTDLFVGPVISDDHSAQVERLLERVMRLGVIGALDGEVA
jgi:hypothetical protein